MVAPCTSYVYIYVLNVYIPFFFSCMFEILTNKMLDYKFNSFNNSVKWKIAKCPNGGIHTPSIYTTCEKGRRRDFPCVFCKVNARIACTECGVLCKQCRCTVFIQGDTPPDDYKEELKRKRMKRISERKSQRKIKYTKTKQGGVASSVWRNMFS